MRNHARHAAMAAMSAASVFFVAASPASAGLREAVKVADTSLKMRYRLEAVDQEGMDERARASTARARLSWLTTPSEGFSAGVEADYVFVVGAEDYNSTDNGHTRFPVVADPAGFDLNQAFVRYRKAGWTVTAGRQRIGHAEQRFVGTGAWRQNEQTYDGLRVQSSVGSASFDYSFVGTVNRVFGPRDGAQPGDWTGSSHFLRASFTPVEGHLLAAFAYLLDFENDNGPANSNASYGLDYQGAFGPFGVAASIARQSDWADNPVSYEVPYYAVEGSLRRETMTYAVGYEVLGSDSGVASFRTPLASLHKFQGWSDKLVATPPAGVRDTYVRVSTKLGNATLAAALHDFQADEGGTKYGREADVSVAYAWRTLAMQLKLARYRAQDWASDTTKVWFMLGYDF